MQPTRWRHSTTHLGIAAAVLALAGAVVVMAAVVLPDESGAGARVVAPTPTATAAPGVVPVSEDAPVPAGSGLAAALAGPLADPNLGRLTGRITDALTGKALWTQQEDLPVLPASTNKVLTAAAALLALDRDARVTTRVTAGAAPGVVVLVGGGDPTLSTAEAGADTWYREAARIDDLAEQVRNSGVDVTEVQVDVSAFTGPTMAAGWDSADIEGGDIAPIEAVMVDGGRVQPTTVESRRSLTPALDAGRVLAAALGVDPDRVSIASAPVTGRELGAVRSAPLVVRLGEMMNASDNVMAECIGREVAAAMGRPRSFAGAVDAVTNRLATAHIAVSGARLSDSSGLSVDDRLSARILDAVIQAAAGPDLPELRPLLDMLPVAGGSGTLSERFLNPQTGRGAAGWLRAKTGSLSRTNALAGIVTDRDQRVLTFAFISNDAGPTGRTAIDALAAVLRTCGCR
ncbi:D-alanyl-D-alanine carboxypeptidase/D-alanyl-D-alanine-endopeptidase [Mycolicibacter hiberniae]|uniref:D-alanyl-D-alanine carboxypeptidase/D-alanyl-D-alanine-endopeptidase n=1 Tax=Mycolicibacter hiberniae TaxID=29314 RepID=A0A7I7X565_9MYCO|nr:D-alanyl-D-alanine carboxypeptidase/D-alanyl-D-alanine-endopeptidase [Mycolicibacter hiberniae]MCV7087719.1 D-alanyl-D-alanine carboxypeptidase/D-alanyl-D-alanine-endopeptidase [Mycolicibacter hiberniae]ORV72219.1 D-alanyl-D-alanine carboxypeptidase [Mycolicibacter hiberniae]BBZ24754.1 D-alanyl-D-alanine carboxypeptidase/D-alanyl-D-alanine-endopeptidase [Mycolicibacter hiberniae]